MESPTTAVPVPEGSEGRSRVDFTVDIPAEPRLRVHAPLRGGSVSFEEGGTPMKTPKTPITPKTPKTPAVVVLAPPAVPSIPHQVEAHPHRQRKSGAEVHNNFKKPQQIFAAIVAAAQYKAQQTFDRTFLSAMIAGAYIAIGGTTAVMMGGGIPAIKAADPAMGKFYYGLLFPFCLALIVILGGDLFTSNVSILASGVLSRRTSLRALCKNWGLVYLGNFAGALFVAGLLVYAGHIAHDSPYIDFVHSIVHKKIHGATFGQQIARGIGCNWMVNLSVWASIAAEDITGKFLAIWFPILAFFVIGFEHSIVNMFLLPLGLMLGEESTVGEMFASNLVPVTIGNIIGGMFLALPYWYIYWLPSHPLRWVLCKRKGGKDSGNGNAGAENTAASGEGEKTNTGGDAGSFESATPSATPYASSIITTPHPAATGDSAGASKRA